MSRLFKGSFVLTKDEISSADGSRNDRGSGGGPRALTKTAASSTQGRATHPEVNRRKKRIVRFVVAGDGRGRLQTKELTELAVPTYFQLSLAKPQIDAETT